MDVESDTGVMCWYGRHQNVIQLLRVLALYGCVGMAAIADTSKRYVCCVGLEGCVGIADTSK